MEMRFCHVNVLLSDRPVNNNSSSLVDYQWSCFAGGGGGGGGGWRESTFAVSEAFSIVFV